MYTRKWQKIDEREQQSMLRRSESNIAEVIPDRDIDGILPKLIESLEEYEGFPAHMDALKHKNDIQKKN